VRTIDCVHRGGGRGVRERGGEGGDECVRADALLRPRGRVFTPFAGKTTSADVRLVIFIQKHSL
jgi:hypothetical protein